MIKKIALRGAIFIAVSAIIYFGMAAGLTAAVVPAEPADVDQGLSFQELYFDYSGLPELQPYRARDGTTLYYRHYPAESDTVLVLLHGSGWHSRYLLPLARYISSQGLARVYTPDLRGHGENPQRRGDIDYIGQLTDDLADLIAAIGADSPGVRLVIGGHSSGGGLAIRFAGTEAGTTADAWLLLAPFLKYNAPTARPDAGWAQPYTGRIIGLSMLNNAGIRKFNYLPVIRFNMPHEARDGTETLTYSYRLNTGFAPDNYKKDLAAIERPLLVIAGSADEVFYADRYEEVISRYTDVEVELLPGVTHMGVVVGDEVRPAVKEWLLALEGAGASVEER